MKLGVNIKEIESIKVIPARSYNGGYDWYDARPTKRFLFFVTQKPITKAGFYQNLGWDSEELDGPYTAEEIAEKDTTLFVDHTRKERDSLYKKPYIQINLRSGNCHGFHFNTIAEIEYEIKQMLEKDPSIVIHWIER